MPEIKHTFRIQGNEESIEHALTTLEGLAGWWTQDVDGDPNPEGILTFRFNDGAVQFKMEVKKAFPPHKVIWACTAGHPEWVDTLISFDLNPAQNGEGILVQFTHHYWKSTEGIYGNCTFDWGRYLRSMKLLIETGKGNPHPETMA